MPKSPKIGLANFVPNSIGPVPFNCPLSGTGLGQWHAGFRRWSSRVPGDATSIDSVDCNEDRQRGAARMDGAVGTRSVPLHRACVGRRTCVPRARPVRDVADAGPSAGGIGGRRPSQRGASPGTVGHWPRPVARRLSPVVESGARGRNEHRQRLLQRGSTAGGRHGWMGLSELDLSPCTVLALAEDRVCHGLGPCGTWRMRLS